MATEVVMPKLGLTMEKGTIGAWLAGEGDEVDKGKPILEVVTDKVTMEVEAQASGVLRKILVQAGTEVDVSTPIGVIAGAEEDIDDMLAAYEAGAQAAPTPTAEPEPAPLPAVSAPPAPAPPPAAAGPVPGAPSASPQIRESNGRPHRASPKARKMAAELGVDLNRIRGSGPGGRIVSADLTAPAAAAPLSAPLQPSVAPVSAQPQRPATAPAVAPLEETVVPLTRAQEIAAERLTASSRDVPHIHVWMEISAVWLQQFRQGYSLGGKKISYNDLVVKAVARTLTEFPRFNAAFENGAVRQLGEVNIGIAADTPQGLLVPVLRNAASLTVEQISQETTRLVDGARQGRLSLDELSGGTFTISNLGMFGVSRFTAIINPPQVAILAVGAVEKRVVALENDALAVRPHMSVDLAADHRALDGAMCARFLRRLKEVIETPGLLA